MDDIHQMLQQTQVTNIIQTLSITLRPIAKYKKGFENLCHQVYTGSERKKQYAFSKTRDQIKGTRPKLLHSAKNTPVELFRCLTAKIDCNHPTRLDL